MLPIRFTPKQQYLINFLINLENIIISESKINQAVAKRGAIKLQNRKAIDPTTDIILDISCLDQNHYFNEIGDLKDSSNSDKEIEVTLPNDMKGRVSVRIDAGRISAGSLALYGLDEQLIATKSVRERIIIDAIFHEAETQTFFRAFEQLSQGGLDPNLTEEQAEENSQHVKKLQITQQETVRDAITLLQQQHVEFTLTSPTSLQFVNTFRDPVNQVICKLLLSQFLIAIGVIEQELKLSLLKAFKLQIQNKTSIDRAIEKREVLEIHHNKRKVSASLQDIETFSAFESDGKLVANVTQNIDQNKTSVPQLRVDIPRTRAAVRQYYGDNDKSVVNRADIIVEAAAFEAITAVKPTALSPIYNALSAPGQTADLILFTSYGGGILDVVFSEIFQTVCHKDNKKILPFLKNPQHGYEFIDEFLTRLDSTILELEFNKSFFKDLYDACQSSFLWLNDDVFNDDESVAKLKTLLYVSLGLRATNLSDIQILLPGNTEASPSLEHAFACMIKAASLVRKAQSLQNEIFDITIYLKYVIEIIQSESSQHVRRYQEHLDLLDDEEIKEGFQKVCYCLQDFYRGILLALCRQLGRINQKIYFTEDKVILNVLRQLTATSRKATKDSDTKDAAVPFILQFWSWEWRKTTIELKTCIAIRDILTSSAKFSEKIAAIRVTIETNQPAFWQIWQKSKRQEYNQLAHDAEFLCLVDAFCDGQVGEAGLITQLEQAAEHHPNQTAKQFLDILSSKLKAEYESKLNDYKSRFHNLDDNLYKKYVNYKYQYYEKLLDRAFPNKRPENNNLKHLYETVKGRRSLLLFTQESATELELERSLAFQYRHPNTLR